MGSIPFKLLIIDDTAANRELLVRYFGSRGYRTAEAPNGQTALNMLRQQRFDAVFLDILMPEVDGIEVLTKIRTLYSPIELPVIMVSALTARHNIRLALDLGANDYLTKPIDLGNALNKLQRALGSCPSVNDQLVRALVSTVPNRRERRKRPRRNLTSTAWLVMGEQSQPTSCGVNDLCDLGAGLALLEHQQLPKDFVLLLVENGAVWRKCRLIWQTGLRAGIEFNGSSTDIERHRIGSLVDYRF